MGGSYFAWQESIYELSLGGGGRRALDVGRPVRVALRAAKGAGDLATHLALALRSRDKKAQLGGHDVSFGGQPAGHVFALRLPVAGAGDGNA